MNSGIPEGHWREPEDQRQANRAGMWRFIALVLLVIVACSLDSIGGLVCGFIALSLLAFDP